MKIKKEFCMRNICGENTLVPIGETAASFKGIIKVNNIGAFIWNYLEDTENEEEIASMVASEYNIELNEARRDVDDFIKYLKDVNII